MFITRHVTYEYRTASPVRKNNHPGDKVLLKTISEPNVFLLREMKVQDK